LHRPEVREKLTKLGYEPVGSNGAELAVVQRNDLRRWEAPIQSAGVKLD
jgi:tripartite-type tricarboxylate transporter receptor subunit TctC